MTYQPPLKAAGHLLGNCLTAAQYDDVRYFCLRTDAVTKETEVAVYVADAEKLASIGAKLPPQIDTFPLTVRLAPGGIFDIGRPEGAIVLRDFLAEAARIPLNPGKAIPLRPHRAAPEIQMPTIEVPADAILAPAPRPAPAARQAPAAAPVIDMALPPSGRILTDPPKAIPAELKAFADQARKLGERVYDALPERAKVALTSAKTAFDREVALFKYELSARTGISDFKQASITAADFVENRADMAGAFCLRRKTLLGFGSAGIALDLAAHCVGLGGFGTAALLNLCAAPVAVGTIGVGAKQAVQWLRARNPQNP